MSEMITVTIENSKKKNIKKEYKKGTALYQIARELQSEFDKDIILAFVNKKLQELHVELENDCEICFVTVDETVAWKAYVRGIKFMMLKALYDKIPSEQLETIRIEYSMGNAYYCEAEGSVEITDALLQKVEDTMKEYVKEDMVFRKYSISTTDARALFEYYKMYDKKKLFEYRRVSNANIYDLGGFKDYFYGYMPYSTGILKCFHLKKFSNGFMLHIPDIKNPEEKGVWMERPKLFQTLQESKQWGKTMEISTVGALNEVIAKGGISDLILVQEALQEKKIAQMAEMISKGSDKKFVMIAGPSSSGKTTFSHRLSIQLRAHGLKPHPIGLDDYFLNREDTPRDENGNYNFECLEAIDIKQFNEDMVKLLNGKEVELPTFNFKTGKREYKGNVKKLGRDDILVIEGIHGLNDALSYALPRESKFKIYISALTQLNIDEHNRIPTTDGRLIRRMVRDARTRGTQAKDTIAMWPSVRRGEEQYIFPFQEDADVMFNSALIYELAVLKQYAEPILFGIPKDCEEYVEAKRLLKFLDYFIGVSSEEIPKNSICREFVGGSIFNV